MNLFIKFDFNAVCTTVLEHCLQQLDIAYDIVGFGEVSFPQPLSEAKKEEFLALLAPYQIEIVEDHKRILVQKIKDAILEMIYDEDTEVQVKSSVYLSEKLGHSYGYLSNLFSEVTYTSIENFIILQKIEYTKQLIIQENLSLTEIAYKLRYSSVAHLSTQFKNTTGITPSAFQRIIAKRKQNLST